MGGSDSKEANDPSVHFTDEERVNIAEMFKTICHGKETMSKDNLQSFTGSVLPLEFSSHLFELMTLTHQGGREVTLTQFMRCLSSLLRGSVTERAHIVLFLAAGNHPEATSHQLVKCVIQMIYSFTRVAETHINFKTWMFHRDEDAYTRMALWLLEDLFHTGAAKDRGMGVPVVPDNTSYNQSQIEDWLSRCNILLLMFEQVFQGCFFIYSHEERSAHHLFPRIPEAKDVNWAKAKTILDLPTVIYLNSILPRDKQLEWRLLFTNTVFGDSFVQLLQKITEKGPSIVVVRDKDGHVFGGYANQDWSVGPRFVGDSQCLLFSLKPHFGVYTHTGYNDHFMYLNHLVHTMPNGLGMGGQLEYFGLWIDHTFSQGHSKVGPLCTTYGSPQLSCKSEFEVDTIEVWAVGPEKKVEDDDITDESLKKKSILDKDPAAQALLTLVGKGPVSEGLREEDSTASNPEHNKVVSLF